MELVANLSLLHAAKAMGPNTKLPTRNEIGAAHSVVMIARAQMGHPDPLISTSFHSDPDAIQLERPGFFICDAGYYG